MSRVYVTGNRPDVRVPFREVALSDPAAPSLRLYDTSGPHGDPSTSVDYTRGLEPHRMAWIVDRDDVETVRRTSRPGGTDAPGDERPVLRARPGRRVTQMHYARQGRVTPEMEFVAAREGMEAEFVRDEIARGRAILPSNINHSESEPMCI